MIYLDNNATTPLLPEVRDAMLFDLDGIPKNPSSITTYGRMGKEKIILARRQIANYFNVLPEEIYFTSGGTEANHMLIHGFHKRKSGKTLSTKIEHPSLLEPLKLYNPTYLSIDESGKPKVEEIESFLKNGTFSFVMLSGANTETGVLLDLEEIANLCDFYNTPLLIDGVGLLGKVDCSLLPKGVSAISFSGHKIHGPKGIGFVIIRKKFKIPPLFLGGHQERGMRAGTENLAGILGLAKAVSLIDKATFKKMEVLRNYFETTLLTTFNEFEINGKGKRIPNTSNIFFNGICAETLLMNLDQTGVIASLGSACSSGTLQPSHVLLGMNYSKQRALSSLRFSLSRLTTKEELTSCLSILKKLIAPTKAL